MYFCCLNRFAWAIGQIWLNLSTYCSTKSALISQNIEFSDRFGAHCGIYESSPLTLRRFEMPSWLINCTLTVRSPASKRERSIGRLFLIIIQYIPISYNWIAKSRRWLSWTGKTCNAGCKPHERKLTAPWYMKTMQLIYWKNLWQEPHI